MSIEVTREQLLAISAQRREQLVDYLLSRFGEDGGFREAMRALAELDPAPARSAGDPRIEKDDLFMVGESQAIKLAFAAIRKFALTDAPVLITGETGTGKELAAQAIHERSGSARGPFVAVNCGALPPTLIASELFGHERGAFTGAHQRRIGRLEAARGGTIFLDEIGDLPLELQPHLLRFLQERKLDRVGGNRPIEVDARVVAATNVDLQKAVREGRFRQDLYYRLNVLTVHMPPLRERGEDVQLLAMFFLRKIAAEMNRTVQGFDREGGEALRRYRWPGNVRELISRIRSAVVISEGEWLTRQDLGLDDEALGEAAAGMALDPAALDAQGPRVISLGQAKEQAEGASVRSALLRHSGNVTRAAQELGVSRVTLYRLMDKYGVEPSRSRAS